MTWRTWPAAVFLLFAMASCVQGEGKFLCPMNVTQEVEANPWMLNQCFTQDESHCCQAILDLIKILHFAWVHSTGTFLLPSNRTAALCVEQLNQQLLLRGVNSKTLSTCRLGLQNFISDSQTCNNITGIQSFERAIDPSGMKTFCTTSGPNVFKCGNCLTAMAKAVNTLNGVPGGDKTNCPAFVMMYVGGVINCYDGLGPDAAYCLLSIQNLSSVAVGRRSEKGFHGVPRMIFVAVVPLIVVLVSVLSCFRWVRYTQHLKLVKRYEILSETTGLTFYSLAEIREATLNFSERNLIGEGGFGLVYKGILPSGSQIAVKRFKDCTKKGDEDFTHEVQVISSIKHRNLLPLRGYCVDFTYQVQERLLVYDFMEKGNLQENLFSPTRPCLPWPQRYKIALGIARGLAYLHKDTKPAIIHRDIKAANVLLESDLNPLVADFGMAKFKTEDRTHYTTRTVGTLGYVAPEYALYGHLNDKSDVFSFGILVLELLTGRRAFDTKTACLEHVLISDWVVDMTLKGCRDEIIDHRIRDSEQDYNGSMERVLLLAMQCAHPRLVCRPTISQVVLILEAIDQPSADILASLESVGADLEASCNSRGDFTWLISSHGSNGPPFSGSSVVSGSISSNSQDFPV